MTAGRTASRPGRPGARPGPGSRALAALAAAGLAVAPPPLAAQQGTVEAEAGVSHSRPPSGLDVPSATYGLLGLRVTYGESRRGWLWGAGYGGLAASPDAGDWGSLSAGGEIWADERSGFRVGLGARASAFTVGAPDRFQAVTGALFPQLRYALQEDVTLRFRALGSAGSSEVEITRAGLETGSVSSDLWYVGAEPGVTVRTEHGELTGSVAYLDASGGVYRRAGARFSGGRPDLGWSAGLEVWDTPVGAEATVSLSLSIGLEGPWSAHVGGGRADPDPLLDSPAAWQGSGTVAYRLAELGPRTPAPLYRISGSGARRTVRFRLEAPGADDVVLLGDFTGWEPVPLERADGAWTTSVQVRPGVYHFGFRVDGEWHVPEDASGQVTDDWGRTNATLVVPDA